MNGNLFAEAKFNLAWELPMNIGILEKEYAIVISADAYYKTDEVSDEQNNSYKTFLENYNTIMEEVEKLLLFEAGSKEKAIERFTPKMIKNKRNGDYGIVFDDKTDFENGLVIAISPKLTLMGTDEYF